MKTWIVPLEARVESSVLVAAESADQAIDAAEEWLKTHSPQPDVDEWRKADWSLEAGVEVWREEALPNAIVAADVLADTGS